MTELFRYRIATSVLYHCTDVEDRADGLSYLGLPDLALGPKNARSMR